VSATNYFNHLNPPPPAVLPTTSTATLGVATTPADTPRSTLTGVRGSKTNIQDAVLDVLRNGMCYTLAFMFAYIFTTVICTVLPLSVNSKCDLI
jgi:hypothetical protein